MPKFLVFIFTMLFTVSFLIPIAEAKRFGGGVTIGKQRPVSYFNNQANSPRSSYLNNPNKPSGGMSRWLRTFSWFCCRRIISFFIYGAWHDGWWFWIAYDCWNNWLNYFCRISIFKT